MILKVVQYLSQVEQPELAQPQRNYSLNMVAKVAIADIDQQAKNVVEDINDNDGEAIFIETDVTSPEQVQQAIKETIEKFGRLDHGFNNAGILNQPAKFKDIEVDEFDKVIDVDVKGVFLASKYQLEHMVEQGFGTIVNTTSVAGTIADPDMAPYVASKHAVIGLTKSAAFDHAEDGIRVNAVAPGLTETSMTQDWKNDPEKWKEVTGNVPMARAAKPEEIAEMVVFLSSDAASFSTGYVYAADGGQLAH